MVVAFRIQAPELPTWQDCHELWSKKRKRQIREQQESILNLPPGKPSLGSRTDKTGEKGEENEGGWVAQSIPKACLVPKVHYVLNMCRHMHDLWYGYLLAVIRINNIKSRGPQLDLILKSKYLSCTGPYVFFCYDTLWKLVVLLILCGTRKYLEGFEVKCLKSSKYI